MSASDDAVQMKPQSRFQEGKNRSSISDFTSSSSLSPFALIDVIHNLQANESYVSTAH